jgi:hypothetical protein
MVVGSLWFGFFRSGSCCPMLFVSLCFSCLRSVSCAQCCLSFCKEIQTTLGTRNRTKKNKTKRHKQDWAQETERRQTKQRDTNNIGHKKQNEDKQNKEI